MAEPTLAASLLTALRVRIVETFPAQIRTCVEAMSDEQLWWRPNPDSNSAGNLVLHLTGSTRELLCRRIGGFEYQRDRAGEFAATGPIPKARLLADFDAMLAQAGRTLEALSPERLSGPSVDPDRHRLLLEDLVSVAVHIAAHAGQIAYITKLQRPGGLDDLWMKAHRETRAWKA